MTRCRVSQERHDSPHVFDISVLPASRFRFRKCELSIRWIPTKAQELMGELSAKLTLFGSRSTPELDFETSWR